jgi:hypothetical protein
MIISISGKFRSGKDTVAKMISKKLIENGYYTKRRAFADNLKKVVEILTGEKMSAVSVDFSETVYDFTEDQKNMFLDRWGMTLGTMLQRLGTEVMRDNFDKNVWIKSLWNNIKDMKELEAVLVTDTRFKNEMEFLKGVGCITIKVEGDPTKVHDITKRDESHESETSLDSYDKYDFVIKNNGTLEELNNKINFITTQILEHYRHIYINNIIN